jgi:hypothetical protein
MNTSKKTSFHKCKQGFYGRLILVTLILGETDRLVYGGEEKSPKYYVYNTGYAILL